MIESQGFDMPDSVRDATDEYRNKSDKLGLFLADEMEKDGFAETRTHDAYQRYTRWCQSNGFFPENAANFKGMLGNIATVVRKRPTDPRMGNNPQVLIAGYRLKGGEFDSGAMPTPSPKTEQQNIIRI